MLFFYHWPMLRAKEWSVIWIVKLVNILDRTVKCDDSSAVIAYGKFFLKSYFQQLVYLLTFVCYMLWCDCYVITGLWVHSWHTVLITALSLLTTWAVCVVTSWRHLMLTYSVIAWQTNGFLISSRSIHCPMHLVISQPWWYYCCCYVNTNANCTLTLFINSYYK